ncbi:Uncharacterised protein [Escherichia coli]|uniref:Uncharacterized protein n=1 Tax=Escherichia coli TaxID=562 RepID=A0A485JMK3_ECOLX|nr:Uncharacterised protein [Escherichia coli]
MNKAEGFRVRMDGYEYTKGLKKFTLVIYHHLMIERF